MTGRAGGGGGAWRASGAGLRAPGIAMVALALAVLPAGVAGQGAAGIGPGPAPELGVRVERSGGEPDALILQVPRGWRLYAPDPGEAGLPLRLDWLLEGPRGTERTAPVAADYPDPDVGTSGGLLVRSYTGTVRVSLTPPRGALQPDAVRVGWALCRADLCVPGVSDVRWAGPRGDR